MLIQYVGFSINTKLFRRFLKPFELFLRLFLRLWSGVLCLSLENIDRGNGVGAVVGSNACFEPFFKFGDVVGVELFQVQVRLQNGGS